MRSCSQSWMMLVGLSLAVASAGCRGEKAEEPLNEPNASQAAAATSEPEAQTPQPAVSGAKYTNQSTAAEPPEGAASAQPLPQTIPQVSMTNEIAATCKVGVGDTMPDGKLRDLQDSEQVLSGLYGQRLTVICFWTSQSAYATAELADLTPEVAEPNAEKGLRVIGINEGDSIEVARQEAQHAQAKFPVLTDPGGLYFAKVATEGLPRTYVLDAQGKILWFDTEYSGITRDQLLRTIRVVLAGSADAQH
jgi:peroxiredoxin